ncbi:MAG: hypothetical protein H0V51_05400 [Chloroflexi bacterium]|nr:hypothetical protein [Chloroflexota bacterium]
MQLPLLERDAAALLAATNRRTYLDRAGLEPGLPLKPPYDRYSDVCSLETHAWLRDQELADPLKRRLLDFVTTHFLQAAAIDLTDRLAAADASGSIEWIGERIPLRVARTNHFAEPDRDRRHWLDEAVRASTAEWAPLRFERRRVMRGRLDDLDYAGWPALGEELRGLDVEALDALAGSILDQTDELYAQALADQLLQHGLDGGDVWEVDLDWIRRGAAYDSSFPADRLLPALYQTLEGLGIRLEDQGHVQLDLRPRPLKSTRPFQGLIDVDGEIAVSMRPVGGRLDFETLFHSVGLAEPLAHADRSAAFSDRWLPDPTVKAGYGSLFQALAMEPSWLARQLDLDDPRDALRLAAFGALYTVRRLAATVRFDLEHADDEELELTAQRWAEALTETLGVRFFPEQYLEAGADPLAAAASLRGRVFASRLAAFLASEFDEEWHRSARAGRFLVERWREGQRYTADELLRFMGLDGLDPRPMLENVRTLLAQ